MAYSDTQIVTLKDEFLRTLENAGMGIIFQACYLTKVPRSTFYLWTRQDAEFAKKVQEARLVGRRNLVNLAESGLIKNVEKGKEKSIFFVLMNLATEIYGKKPLGDGDVYNDNRKIIVNDPRALRTLLLSAEIVRRKAKEQNVEDVIPEK